MIESEWLASCFSQQVVRRALLSTLIVGSVLVVINHGDELLHSQIDGIRLARICITRIVPHVVSTVSSVSTILSLELEKLE